MYVDGITFLCPVFPLDDELRAHTKRATWISVFKCCVFRQKLVLYNTTTLDGCTGVDVAILPGVKCMMSRCEFKSVYVIGGHIIASDSKFQYLNCYNGLSVQGVSTARVTLERCTITYKGTVTENCVRSRSGIGPIGADKYYDSDGNVFQWEDEPQMLEKRFHVIEAKLREKGLTDELNPLAGSQFFRPMVCGDCANKCVKCGEKKNRKAKELPVPALYCRVCQMTSFKDGCAICGGYIDMEQKVDEELDEEITELKQEMASMEKELSVQRLTVEAIKNRGKEREKIRRKKERLDELEAKRRAQQARWAVPGMRCRSCDEPWCCWECGRADPYVPYIRT